jgi:hypothetical protein
MKAFHVGKDGGPESTVTGYWLVEIKRLFSVALLRFDNGSRESYHSHAFNCVSWVLSGCLREEHLDGAVEFHTRSLLPVVTRRSTFHRVFSVGRTWVLTFRGPWAKSWKEYDPASKRFSTLKNGRAVVKTSAAVSA